MTFELPNWRLLLFSLSFLGLFVYLGVWQLNRATEKEQLLAEAEIKRDLPGEFLTSSGRFSVGDPARVKGAFDPTFVLYADNKVLKGRVGYEVVQLFHADSGLSLLVNRGFVPGTTSRDVLPALPSFNPEPQTIRGHLYLTELSVPGENVSGDRFPKVTQVVNPSVLETQFEREFYPFVLRLEEGHRDALPRFWPVTTMSPERHMGYAVTWFVMAVAIVMALVFSGLKRDPKVI